MVSVSIFLFIYLVSMVGEWSKVVVLFPYHCTRFKNEGVIASDTMNVDKRFRLIRQVGEEILTEEELKELLERKKHPIAYDGFEPSGTLDRNRSCSRVRHVYWDLLNPLIHGPRHR